MAEVKKLIFTKHPYRWATIGSMDHLDASTLKEFQDFNKKYYVPNNAVLVVAGDLNKKKTKKMIQDYFGGIPKGKPVSKVNIKETPITKEIKGTYNDPNIQIPAIVSAYRTPSMKTRDAYVLNMVSTVLSDGKSSRLYKKLVDEKKMALQVGAFNSSQEDYGMYLTYGLPQGETKLEDLVKEIDEEVVKMQTELISEREFEKLQNKYENQFVNSNSSIEGIANSLAKYHMLYGDINLINNEIEIYKSITREEIRDVAKKYLNKNQRALLEYLPKKEETKK
jgi:predicted Zn-dependent peptidase